MSTDLKDAVQSAMKAAMKNKEKGRLQTIRLIWAAIRQAEIDSQTTLSDNDVLVLLDKMLKQRRDAILQFQSANRDDLVEQEQSEIDVIQTFLPEPLSETDINQRIHDAIAQTGASTMKEMGHVMAILKPQLQGRADMAIVSKLIKDRLNK